MAESGVPPVAHRLSRLQMRALARYIERFRIAVVRVLTTTSANPFSKTLMLAMMVLLICVGAAVVATVLRYVSPKSQVTVSAFQVVDSGDSTGATGKALADMFVDDLSKLMQDTNRTAGNAFSSHKRWKPVSSLPSIPVATSYGIEIKGISLDQILATWNRLRYKEYVVGGDLFPGKGGDSILVVRYSAAGVAKSYQTSIKELTPETLKQAMSDLSLKVLEGINPGAAARYLMDLGYNCSSDCDATWETATQFIYSWLKRSPNSELVLSDMGEILYNSKHQQDSLAYFGRAMALDPHDVNTLNTEANALGDLGRQDEADALYNKALKIHKDPDPMLNLGVGALDRGQYGRAEDLFRQALSIDPDDEGAELNLGHALVKDGKFADAAKAYGRALELQPGNETAIYGIAHSYPKAGRTDEALGVIDLFLRLNPGSAYPVAYKAEALMLAGRLDEASDELQASLKILNNLTAQEDIAILHIYHGELAEAGTELDGWIAQFPKAWQLHIYKADVLEQQGDNAGAETERQLADKLYPGARYDTSRWNE